MTLHGFLISAVIFLITHAASAQYSHLDPEALVPQNLLQFAVKFFDEHQSQFKNKKYLTIIDYSQRSDQPRFFVVDLISGDVESYYTAHGIGSDSDDDGFAEVFGNVPGSRMSSVGFVRTAEVYSGKFGRSMRLDGLSPTNSNLRKRAVVVHGWNKVHQAPMVQARTEGCPALDTKVKDSVIDKIKDGSLMYMGLSLLK